MTQTDAGCFKRSSTTSAFSLAANADNAIRDVIAVITVFIGNLMPVVEFAARDYRLSRFGVPRVFLRY
jgi:hypothetical protein